MRRSSEKHAPARALWCSRPVVATHPAATPRGKRSSIKCNVSGAPLLASLAAAGAIAVAGPACAGRQRPVARLRHRQRPRRRGRRGRQQRRLHRHVRHGRRHRQPAAVHRHLQHRRVVRVGRGRRRRRHHAAQGQPLRALGRARHLGKPVPQTCRKRAIRGHADDRLHARQSAPLGIGRKRGEQKQAVGRSRGGRNTKIHALADAKGRLLAILLDRRRSARLSGRRAPHPQSEAAKAHARRQGLRQRRIARGDWISAEPSQSFPTAATGSSRSASASASTSCAGASRARSTG